MADGGGPRLVWLDDPAATGVELVGAKAANLAVSAGAGLPVIPGFVVTTRASAGLDGPGIAAALADDDEARRYWERLTDGGAHPLAVRSSSVAEDSETSSMAGQFLSVLHVTGWDAFVKAVGEVVGSARIGPEAAGMAVLVQPMAQARLGGVMFGLDPLTGDRSRLLVSMTDGLPELIVSGEVSGTSVVLSRFGRLRSVDGPVPAALHAHDRFRLARLAWRTRRLFGGPQDMEWLIEPDGTLRLLQSRPVTASAVPARRSHVFGPGPVAETFPEPLSRLELDLWVPPLEEGLEEALRLSGTLGRRPPKQPYVLDIQGRVAVDLEALGVLRRRRWWTPFDPRPGYRRLRAAWRIGRLRVAMPAIVADLATDVDDALREVRPLATLADHQLPVLLRNTRSTLMGVHAHEILAGLFLNARASSTTGAAVAVATVSLAREDGLADEEIITRFPEALALIPPRVGGSRRLPPTPAYVGTPTGEGDDPMALARETLRLRTRWLQELSALVAMELGRRMARRGQLHHADDVRHLTLDALMTLTVSHNVAVAVPARPKEPLVPALPAAFRLAPDGSLVADGRSGAGPRGVSSGRAQAPLTRAWEGAAGMILLVENLDPTLAAVLPDLAGLVSRTGSPLSHLAILAREYRVPTVVGFPDGLDDLAEGEVLVIDGGDGTVSRLEEDEAAATGADQPSANGSGQKTEKARAGGTRTERAGRVGGGS
ncbi:MULTISPECIES: PEP/pyruvate-binding domain-containing protein [Pseudofrankia]|uniref:PEP/pyruvate-binding domain-containing protein n=1 Tax=Pseudofrankia TaxID=2994363 RepID=UPI000234CBA5|nr:MULTISPECIES: PEP/pyruvate-binding domain-containing protein [Pseudofrankia]OHV31442.1 pyruvate, phosphate dikinase [Pseudofrankia sp. EUN1h]